MNTDTARDLMKDAFEKILKGRKLDEQELNKYKLVYKRAFNSLKEDLIKKQVQVGFDLNNYTFEQWVNDIKLTGWLD